MDVLGCAYAYMMAWQSLFLLQYRETNEVLSGFPFAGRFAKSGPRTEADDVAQR